MSTKNFVVYPMKGLSLSLHTCGTSLSASLYSSDPYLPLAYAAAELQDARVDCDDQGTWTFWLGRAAFDIRPEDAERIAAEFNLRITKPGKAAA